MGIHGLSDFARDTLSAISAGLFLMGISGYLAHRRAQNREITSLRRDVDDIKREVAAIQAALEWIRKLFAKP